MSVLYSEFGGMFISLNHSIITYFLSTKLNERRLLYSNGAIPEICPLVQDRLYIIDKTQQNK